MVCVASVLSGTAARAASVEEELHRLGDLTYYVQELDRGWDPLLGEYERTIAALRADTDSAAANDRLRPLLELRDTVTFERAETLFESGDANVEERCLELYRALAAGAVDGRLRSDAKRGLARLSIRRGEAFEAAGDEDAALTAYLAAVDYAPEYQPGFEKVGALGVSQADSLVAAQEYDAALDTLAQILARIERGLPEAHPSIAAARSRRQTILSTTGVVTLAFVGDAAVLEGVRGPRTDFRQGAIVLTPRDGGVAPPTVSAANPRRVRCGSFDATVTGAEGDATVSAPVEVAASGGTITVPVAIPDGMVWVPAGGGVGSFLCDRTEVSGAAYAEYERGADPAASPGGAELPATGISWEGAAGFATWAGKQLPTRAQWVWAATGDPSGGTRTYPWGDQPGTPGVHFIGGQRDPGPVDSCPDGASAWGVLNMARNAWEWLADRWFIGGGWTKGSFAFDVPYTQGGGAWTLELLKDAVPSPEAFNAFPDGDPDKNKYRVLTERSWDVNAPQIGFRCVIPFE